MDSGVEQTRELPQQITIKTDTRDILEHARQQGEIRNFENVFIFPWSRHTYYICQH